MQYTSMYSNAHIDENIKFKEVTTNDNIKVHNINLDATKHNYACAIIDKKDILECKYGNKLCSYLVRYIEEHFLVW